MSNDPTISRTTTNIATDPSSVAGDGSLVINFKDGKIVVQGGKSSKTSKNGVAGTTTNIATGPNSAAGNNSRVFNFG